MTKSAAVTWGDAPAQVRAEYVKTRRVLRFTGSDPTSTPVEVPLDEFLADLGIDIDQLAPPPRYLLFAAVGSGVGVPPRHVVATYIDETEAREAFWALRLGYSQPGNWAEVASVEASGGLRRMCWFGTPWGPGGRDTGGPTLNDPPSPTPGPARGSRRTRWRLRSPAPVTAMPMSAE